MISRLSYASGSAVSTSSLLLLPLMNMCFFTSSILILVFSAAAVSAAAADASTGDQVAEEGYLPSAGSNSYSWSRGSSSWSFPGSSTSSWWWSSSTGNSDYSTGNSFYTQANMWHDAGHMKTAFAGSCGGFTLQGDMRYIGGYYNQEMNSTDPKAKKKIVVVHHSNAVIDLRYPDTTLLSNTTLPPVLDDASGPGSCALNAKTGYNFVMLGNRPNTHLSPPSNIVYGLSDALDLAINMSLPFHISRSSVAAPILKPDVNKDSDNSVADDHNQHHQHQHHSDFDSTPKLPAPDAIIIGGIIAPSSSGGSGGGARVGAVVHQNVSYNDKIWGFNLRLGQWFPYCSLNETAAPRLCDCVSVAVPYSGFIAVCSNCTSKVFRAYLIEINCIVRDLVAPPLLGNEYGLEYVHGVLVGKFATFVYQPFGWSTLFVTMFDREMFTWSPELKPANLVPPRVHSGYFSWLGRLQLAGGQELFVGKDPRYRSAQDNIEDDDNDDVAGKSVEQILASNAQAKLKKKRQQQQLQQQQQQKKKTKAETAADEENENAAFYPPALSSLQQKQEKQQHQREAAVAAAAAAEGQAGGLASNAMTIVNVIQELSIVRIDAPTMLGGSGANGRTFIAGSKIEIECTGSVYLKLSGSNDCLDLLPGTRPTQCDGTVANMLVNRSSSRAYLCASPGTCELPQGRGREHCPGLPVTEGFGICSGGNGCCWHPTAGCYKYLSEVSDGDYGYKLFYYLASPMPIVILPSPAPTNASTTSPSSDNNNNTNSNTNSGDGNSTTGFNAFMATRTGKLVVILSASVVGLALILGFVSYYRRTSAIMNQMGGGGDFDLHDFVAERYDVIKELGRGGFGTVYLAVRKTDKKELALKVIACNTEDDVQSALSEFQLLRQVKSHPGMMPIVDVHCSWEYDAEQKTMRKVGSATNLTEREGRLPTAPLMGGSTASSTAGGGEGRKIQQQQFVCIVMEYFAEGDLAHFVAKTFDRGGGPSETWLWTVLARQIFSVLAHLHSQSPPIWHRDLKPENVMCANNGNRLVMTDFGLAAQVDRTFMSTRAGSFHYLAPECWAHRYTASVDVWSAGCILYAAATGCVAPPAARVMFNDARHPSFAQEIRDDLRSYSSDFANLVLSILKMDPAQRPTANQLLERVTKKCQELLTPTEEDCNSGKNSSSVQLTQSSQSVSVNGDADKDDDDDLRKNLSGKGPTMSDSNISKPSQRAARTRVANDVSDK